MISSISVPKIVMKNGHGWSVLKDLWITNMLEPATTITLIGLEPKVSNLNFNFKMEEKVYQIKSKHHLQLFNKLSKKVQKNLRNKLMQKLRK